jgi:hypothetical protein
MRLLVAGARAAFLTVLQDEVSRTIPSEMMNPDIPLGAVLLQNYLKPKMYSGCSQQVPRASFRRRMHFE